MANIDNWFWCLTIAIVTVIVGFEDSGCGWRVMIMNDNNNYD